MRRIILIAGREFRSIIGSGTGLTVIAIYLVLAGYMFSLDVASAQEATVRYLLGNLGLLTLFVVPLITMRLLAEEVRTGTFEILTTHPVTDTEIVMGKFLAGWATFAVMSAPTFTYLLILQSLGSPDWGPALCGYGGQQLLAAMLIAMGLLISGLSSNQVLAAMGAMVGGLLLKLAGTAAYSIQGPLGNALAYLAVFEHYSLFRRGVVDTRALIYFSGTTVLFLYLAVRAVESRRWKFGRIPDGMANRWTAPRLSLALAGMAGLAFVGIFVSRITGGYWSGFHAVLAAGGLVLLLLPAVLNRHRLRYHLARRQSGIVLTVAVNSLLVVAIWALLTFMTSRHYLRFDLTSSQHYALSPLTLQVLHDLSSPVEIVTVMSRSTDLRDEVRDLLAEYRARSARISVREIDPTRNPSDMDQVRNAYKLTSPLADELLVASGEKTKRVPIAAFLRNKAMIVNGAIQHTRPQFVGEAEVTATLIQLTQKTPGAVVFLGGHGERDIGDASDMGLATVAAELKRNGWKVAPHVVTPGAAGQFSPEVQVAVVAGPQKRLANEDLKALETLLDRGGGVLCLVDPGVTTGLDPLLSAWDFRLADDIVVDLQDHLANTDPTGLYVTHFEQEHPIGKGMGTLAAVLPTARRIAINLANANPNVFTRSFMHTSGNGWSVARQPDVTVPKIDRQRDKRGPISLGVAGERSQAVPEPGHVPLQGRLVVIGDSDFACNQYVDMAGNLNLFLNAVDWLAGRQNLVSVRPKVMDTRTLSLTRRQTQTVFWVSVVVVPGLVTAVGMMILIARRRRT